MLRLIYLCTNSDNHDEEWFMYGRSFSNDWRTKIVTIMVGLALERIVVSRQWQRAKIIYPLGEVLWDSKYGYERILPLDSDEHKALCKRAKFLGTELKGWFDVAGHFHVEPETMYGHGDLRGY